MKYIKGSVINGRYIVVKPRWGYNGVGSTLVGYRVYDRVLKVYGTLRSDEL